MNFDAVQRLREPAAWILVGAAALQLLAGLVNLFQSKLTFSVAALLEISNGALFTDVTVVGMAVLAALLVTVVGAGTPPQARVIVISALAVTAGVLLFGLISWLAGLTADSQFVVTSKLAAFLYGLAKLAVAGLGGYVILTLFRTLAPHPPQGAVQGQQYPGYAGYGQPGEQGQPQQYGQQYEGQYGQQPGQSYEQGAGYGQQPYYEQGQAAQGQPPAHQGDQAQSQQYGQRGGQAYPYGYGQQQPGQPAQPGQQQPYSQGEGDWTQAYGSGERAGQSGQPGQPGQGSGYGQQQPYPPQSYGRDAEQRSGEEPEQNWYRDDRGQQ